MMQKDTEFEKSLTSSDSQLENTTMKELRRQIPLLILKVYSERQSKNTHCRGKQIYKIPEDWPGNIVFLDPNNKRTHSGKPTKLELMPMFKLLLQMYRDKFDGKVTHEETGSVDTSYNPYVTKPPPPNLGQTSFQQNLNTNNSASKYKKFEMDNGMDMLKNLMASMQLPKRQKDKIDYIYETLKGWDEGEFSKAKAKKMGEFFAILIEAKSMGDIEELAPEMDNLYEQCKSALDTEFDPHTMEEFIPIDTLYKVESVQDIQEEVVVVQQNNDLALNNDVVHGFIDPRTSPTGQDSCYGDKVTIKLDENVNYQIEVPLSADSGIPQIHPNTIVHTSNSLYISSSDTKQEIVDTGYGTTYHVIPTSTNNNTMKYVDQDIHSNKLSRLSLDDHNSGISQVENQGVLAVPTSYIPQSVVATHNESHITNVLDSQNAMMTSSMKAPKTNHYLTSIKRSQSMADDDVHMPKIHKNSEGDVHSMGSDGEGDTQANIPNIPLLS